MSSFKVNSAAVEYTEDYIYAKYEYHTSKVCTEGDNVEVHPGTTKLTLRTQREVPRVGVLLVGIGGNNGTTMVAGILANKHKYSWEDKTGTKHPNYYGSITMSSTIRVGSDRAGKDVYVPMNKILPMVHPESLVIGGWDISSMPLGDAMKRAAVIDIDLQKKLYAHMNEIIPLPGVYFQEYIASNQSARADNILTGTKKEQLEKVRSQIRQFKAKHSLDKVVVMWTGNTECYSRVVQGVNTTADELMKAVAMDHEDVSPSTLYCLASITENCSYINGSPQNTFVPGVVELAKRHNVFLAGDDFKSGQTKMKSIIVDFLVSAGLKPVSIASYNHLGNNDGRNLSSPKQFRSKEISKSNVIDDIVESNGVLYGPGEKPDHCIVIQYMPYVGDSKRAMDEYTSEIFLNGKNTLVLHNTCEDSLLAAPLMIDLIILTELAERIGIRNDSDGEECFQTMDTALSLVSYFTKAPFVPAGTPIVNSLYRQQQCVTNIIRACVGLPPDDHMLLEHKAQQCLQKKVFATAGPNNHESTMHRSTH